MQNLDTVTGNKTILISSSNIIIENKQYHNNYHNIEQYNHQNKHILSIKKF